MGRPPMNAPRRRRHPPNRRSSDARRRGLVGMQNLRLSRLWSRVVPVVATTIVVWVVAPTGLAYASTSMDRAQLQTGTRPLTAPDPFHGQIPGDVSDGKGVLPPVTNAPSAGAVVQNALPGANVTQTRFGPIDDMDRLFLVKVRQAGLWERPSALLAAQQ